MFTTHFLISNSIISAVFIILAAVKRLSGSSLSPRAGYMFWLPFIMLTLLAFMPSVSLPVPVNESLSSEMTGTGAGFGLNPSGEINDLYVPVGSYDLVFVIWLTGACIHAVMMLAGMIRLRGLTRRKISSPVFDNCCTMLDIKADFYISSSVSSPLSFGIIRPKVVLPDIKLSDKQLEHIVLHELVHHKHGDILVNFILCIINAVYWFNPLIYIAFDRVRLDMEIYCDYTAIGYSGSNIDYGNTVISLSEGRGRLKIAAYMSTDKGGIKSRIIRIADFNKKYSPVCRRAVAALLMMVFLSGSLLMNCFGYTITDDYNAAMNISTMDLTGYFKDQEGCFVLYDTHNGSYSVYNEEMARERVSPYSTYKIAIALNGLENGVISRDNSFVDWDGSEQPFEQWEQGHDMYSAMENSVNWYFQSIDRELTAGEIRSFLKEVDYGNGDMGYDRDNYWLENSLKISPIEQVNFLKGIYNNEYGFDEDNVSAVLESIRLSEDLYGKTGTGMINGRTTSGWFIGIKGKYIFAVRVKSEDNATGSAAREIAEAVFADLY